MLNLRVLVTFVAAIMATAAGPIPLGAQSASGANQPDSISIHISLQENSYAVKDKPIMVLAIRNVSSSDVWFSTEHHLCRIYLTSKTGDLPKTEFYRHLLGDRRPGESSIGLLGGSVISRRIASGAVDSQKCDLSAYYDLSTPGDYSVCLEIYDPAGPSDGSGHRLRTNTAKFEIQAPTQ